MGLRGSAAGRMQCPMFTPGRSHGAARVGGGQDVSDIDVEEYRLVVAVEGELHLHDHLRDLFVVLLHLCEIIV